MSRHGYRISICFSDKAVTTPVSHWNSINLVHQGPMRKSKLHLTLYQLTITYKWTLPVSIQQVMILLSIRLLANKKKKIKLRTECLVVLFCFVCLVFRFVILFGGFVVFYPSSNFCRVSGHVSLCIILLRCDLIAASNQVKASLKCAWISLDDITYATFLQYLINHKETKTHMAWGNNWKIRWPFGNWVNFWTRGTEKKKY